MADIVNLKRARKARQRAAHERQAAVNRGTFGESKQNRALRQARAETEASRLEGHRREARNTDASDD